jgi:hypothetical protein
VNTGETPSDGQAPEVDFDDEFAVDPRFFRKASSKMAEDDFATVAKSDPKPATVKDDVEPQPAPEDIEALLAGLDLNTSGEVAVEEIRLDWGDDVPEPTAPVKDDVEPEKPEPIRSSTAERIPALGNVEELLADPAPAAEPLAEAIEPEAIEPGIERSLEEAINKREREEAEAALRAPTPLSGGAAEDDFMPGFNPKLFYKTPREAKRERLPSVKKKFAEWAEAKAAAKAKEIATKAAPDPRRELADEAQARLDALRAATRRTTDRALRQYRGREAHLAEVWLHRELAILDAPKGVHVSYADLAASFIKQTGEPYTANRARSDHKSLMRLECDDIRTGTADAVSPYRNHRRAAQPHGSTSDLGQARRCLA